MMSCTLQLLAVVVASAHTQLSSATFDRIGFKSALDDTLCLSIPEDDITNGAQPMMWDCLGKDAQQWYLSEDNKIVFGGEASSFKCIDLIDGDVTNGATLQLWDCLDSNAQAWGFDSETGILYHGTNATEAEKCLQRSSLERDSRVEISDCIANQESQVWIFGSVVPAAGPTAQPTTTPAPQPTGPPVSGVHSVISVQNGMCLDLPAGITTNGIILEMWDCSRGDTQRWSFQDDSVRYQPGNKTGIKCLDSILQIASGNEVGLWDCNGHDEQKWRFDSAAGTIQSVVVGMISNYWCLEVGRHPGLPITIRTCDGSGHQKWSAGNPTFDSPSAGPGGYIML